MKKLKYLILFAVSLTLILHTPVWAQTSTDTVSAPITLQQAVQYALRNQPAVKQAAIDEQINERDIRIGLSAWLPQVNSSG
ncbi:MAG TPA: TolC family protein, partial [Mucilaginibacter sp.]